MKRTAAPREYVTPALEKGLDVLELLAREPEGLTKTAVARRLGRTVSEVFRMLACLEARGYIARSDGDGRYSLTLLLFRLAYQHPPIERLTSEALPIMRQVTRELNQSCHLGTLDGDRLLVIAQVNPPVASGFSKRPGGIGELMHSTTAHVILSHQTPDFCSRAIRLWSEHTGMQPPRDFGLHLSRIKKRGFDERKSYEVEGVINISFPVLDDRGFAVAALSVPFVQRIGDSITPATVRRVLHKASGALSEAIGCVGNQNDLVRGPSSK